MDPNTMREIQEAAREYNEARLEAMAAAVLASGLLVPGKHTPLDAIAMYRDVLVKLRADGGL